MLKRILILAILSIIAAVACASPAANEEIADAPKQEGNPVITVFRAPT